MVCRAKHSYKHLICSHHSITRIHSAAEYGVENIAGHEEILLWTVSKSSFQMLLIKWHYLLHLIIFMVMDERISPPLWYDFNCQFVILLSRKKL